MKKMFLFVSVLSIVGVAVEAHASAQRVQYVAGQNAFHHSDIRFSSEGAWNTTFVIYDDNERDEFDADACSTDPYFTRAFRRPKLRLILLPLWVEKVGYSSESQRRVIFLAG